MVCPGRRQQLLDPLIERWEGRTGSRQSAKSSGILPENTPVRYPLSAFILGCNEVLAPLSVARRLLGSPKRRRPRSHTNGGTPNGQDSDPPTRLFLYLHVRLGLLTASTPIPFGGRDGSLLTVVMESVSTSCDCADTQTSHGQGEGGRPVLCGIRFPHSQAHAAHIRMMSTSMEGVVPSEDDGPSPHGVRSHFREDDIWFQELEKAAFEELARWEQQQLQVSSRCRATHRTADGTDSPPTQTRNRDTSRRY